MIGWIKAVVELIGNGVRHLENAMIMRSDLQDVFDSLILWFEVTVRYCFASLARICPT